MGCLRSALVGPGRWTSGSRAFRVISSLKQLIGLGLVLVGCATQGAEEGRVRVVATTTLVADLVRQLGGERVRVEALMGAGVDPHLYKASAGDVARLGRAQVVFYSGLHLEGRMQAVLEGLASRGRKVVAVSSGVPASELLRPDGFDAHPDPHIWGDPVLWKRAGELVVATLVEIDPRGAAEYRRRGEDFGSLLDGLLEWGRRRVHEVPEARRVLVTSHDAFRYFGRALGLEVVGVQGISTAAAAGLADVTKVVDLTRSRGLPAVFIESSVSPATMERISRDAGVQVGGELFSDALGRPGDIRESGGERYDVGTYAGMFKHNVNTVVNALR